MSSKKNIFVYRYILCDIVWTVVCVSVGIDDRSIEIDDIYIYYTKQLYKLNP